MHCFHQAGVPLKLGLVGEILVVLVVLTTKWKFSGLLFDWRKLVNPPGGYILKNIKRDVQCLNVDTLTETVIFSFRIS